MALGSRKGRGSTLRMMIMTDFTLDAQGNYKRPATFDAAALTLTEVTTSDLPLSIASQTSDPVPVMYGSPDPTNAGEQWADPTPGEASWTATFTGNTQPVEADRANMEALEVGATQRKIWWLERTPNSAGEVARGGACFITGGNFPIPANEVETFTFNVAGKGKRWPDTSAATVAGA